MTRYMNTPPILAAPPVLKKMWVKIRVKAGWLRPSRKCREATSTWAQTGRLVQPPNRSARMLNEPPRPRLSADAFGDICRGRDGDRSPPPAQIRTYRFPISGSCLGSTAKARRRIRMTEDSGWNPTVDKPFHTIPRDVAFLASATEPFLP